MGEEEEGQGQLGHRLRLTASQLPWGNQSEVTQATNFRRPYVVQQYMICQNCSQIKGNYKLKTGVRGGGGKIVEAA